MTVLGAALSFARVIFENVRRSARGPIREPAIELRKMAYIPCLTVFCLLTQHGQFLSIRENLGLIARCYSVHINSKGRTDIPGPSHSSARKTALSRSRTLRLHFLVRFVPGRLHSRAGCRRWVVGLPRLVFQPSALRICAEHRDLHL